jgi:hypothetical protein
VKNWLGRALGGDHMTAVELLRELELQGVALLVAGSDLRCEGDGPPLSPQLIKELRERKAEILSLMKCGQCGALLSGQTNNFWRVLLDTGPVYLCSVACVFKAWPWRMAEGGGS